MNVPLFKARPLAWIIVLTLIAADAWMLRLYWPTLSEPIGNGSAMTKGAATRPVSMAAIRSPGIIRHTTQGIWSVVGHMMEMIATPNGADQFAYRYSFTNADDADRADWLAMLKLQSEIAAANRARSLPPGLSAQQVARIRPLLLPIAAPLDETWRQKLQGELVALAKSADGKKVNDPALAAPERMLLSDLNAAAQTMLPALRKHLNEIEQYVGPSEWARLMPARRGAATPRRSPARQLSLTTRPVGFAPPLQTPALSWSGFAWEAAS